ncbi:MULTISPECIES: ANTAR domain-containing protein [unclassified Arthrobacter]|uniref:ANTAR domain-containing protein n=1 Tax=unclassified Arthrobacter TaxID=235627 RepID=UPI001F1A0357|nr:ANTAR domain-containing protein [Arthrobacter sp. FW305-BF8]UKA56199.1 ANTAR domain-containing protein [Arthrobacter sp. FW305-BF8]
MARDDAFPALEQWQDLLLESPGFTGFLLGVAPITALLLGGTEPMLCAITVERDSAPATVASSTDAALRLDEKQFAFDDGPCLTVDERWERYAHPIAGEGIRSVLAVPIEAGGSSRTALNCYAPGPSALDVATVRTVQEHSVRISKTLRLALRLLFPEPYPEHLRSALQSRAVADAAVSLIMLQNHRGRDRAMELLQLAAWDSNRRLHEIATDLLHGTDRRDPGSSASVKEDQS